MPFPIPSKALRRIALLGTLTLGALTACSPLPETIEKSVSFAAVDTGSTRLGRASRALGNPGDGRSGFRILPDGVEALAFRLALSSMATETIDAQYYLLHDDISGHLFAQALLKAADRGVRVRLLLDDMDTRQYDDMMRALDAHPNIEIRLFNPFRRDRSKAVGALLEFKRINRRMHNKSMTFDNQVTILGGRNIGDEYFSARDDSNYDDLDVLAAGPVAQQVSSSFDGYWNSPHAIPATVLVGEDPAALGVAEARSRLAALVEEARDTPYGAALETSLASALQKGQVKLIWAPGTVYADPPEKAAGALEFDDTLSGAMLPYLRAAETSLHLASAYFVPRKAGTQLFTDMEARGVDVTILTNSMEATDVPSVHGHYAHSRDELLEAGVDLWELKPKKGHQAARERFGLGLSQSSLHAKAYVIDRERVFIGSFNWDPRSAVINSEMGVMIESPLLATRLADGFEAYLPGAAFELALDEDGQIEWLDRSDPNTWYLYRNEPHDSLWRAMSTWFLGLVPIGGQL